MTDYHLSTFGAVLFVSAMTVIFFAVVSMLVFYVASPVWDKIQRRKSYSADECGNPSCTCRTSAVARAERLRVIRDQCSSCMKRERCALLADLKCPQYERRKRA